MRSFDARSIGRFWLWLGPHQWIALTGFLRPSRHRRVAANQHACALVAWGHSSSVLLGPSRKLHVVETAASILIGSALRHEHSDYRGRHRDRRIYIGSTRNPRTSSYNCRKRSRRFRAADPRSGMICGFRSPLRPATGRAQSRSAWRTSPVGTATTGQPSRRPAASHNSNHCCSSSSRASSRLVSHAARSNDCLVGAHHILWTPRQKRGDRQPSTLSAPSRLGQ